MQTKRMLSFFSSLPLLKAAFGLKLLQKVGMALEKEEAISDFSYRHPNWRLATPVKGR